MAETQTRRFLSQRMRQTVLTAHIVVSVGLLGDSAGFLAVAIRASGTADTAAVLEQMRVLGMFGMVFGIPLSVAAIVTGVILGLGSKWGVFRYPWVTTKLLLNLSVMAVGGLVIGPALAQMLNGGPDRTTQLIAAASYDVVALTTATVLSVFKPGGAFSRRAVAAAERSRPPMASRLEGSPR
jgi:hypothetical protein